MVVLFWSWCIVSANVPKHCEFGFVYDALHFVEQVYKNLKPAKKNSCNQLQNSSKPDKQHPYQLFLFKMPITT